MDIVILIGLQASGKSTFFRTHFATEHEHVSLDLLRNNKNPRRRQAQLIESALQAGRSVVVDNTNPTLEERQSLIQIARTYNAEIIGYYFASKVKNCLERNRQRGGKARVPDVAIYATIKRLARPSYAEGFHKLYYVNIVGDSDFEVRAFTENEVDDG